jgi:hypothetical protein
MRRPILLFALLVFAPSPQAAGQTPTPIQRQPMPAYVPPIDGPAEPSPSLNGKPAPPLYFGFHGARTCEQRGRTLTCDNGYRATVQVKP